MTLTKPKPKRPTTATKKRTGDHHRKTSHHYIKAYWPYLPVFAVLLLSLVFNGALSRAHHSVLGYAADISNQSLLDDTNAERAKQGEKPLVINSELVQAAAAKAADMAKRNYWAHVTPDGKQPWTFIVNSGYNYQLAGENLAYGFGSSQQTLTAWMNSTEHRANILNADFSEVGFATVNSPNYLGQGAQTITVAMYAEPAAAPIAVSATVRPHPVTTTLGANQNVSRLQLITPATWAELSVAVLCGAALMLFFIRHARAWHRVLVRSEQFALHHPLFDVLLVSVAAITLLLTHAAGTIH